MKECRRYKRKEYFLWECRKVGICSSEDKMTKKEMSVNMSYREKM